MNFQRLFPIEWPTIALIALVYATLFSVVWFHAELAWWLILPIGSYAACLHSSLQHEVLHGHPTRSRTINELLVFIVPHLWLPYGRYRDTHLQHHNDQHLTCPVQDPESFYVLPDTWNEMPGSKRALFTFNNTLFGRMLIGPLVGILQFWSSEIWAMVRGRRDIVKCWLAFAVSTVFVMAFVVWCGMPIWQYILLIAYPAISLALIRSFCEHQAAENIGERTIIVEASRFWSILFLYNNLHVAHHERPGLPWYRLPNYYADERDRLLAKNNHYLMRGYTEIFYRYFLNPKETVEHPNVGWLK